MNTTTLMTSGGISPTKISMALNQTKQPPSIGFNALSEQDNFQKTTLTNPDISHLMAPKFSALFTPSRTVLGFFALLEIIRHFSNPPIVQSSTTPRAAVNNAPSISLVREQPVLHGMFTSKATIQPFSIVVKTDEAQNLKMLVERLGPKSTVLEGRSVSQRQCEGDYPIPTWASSGLSKPILDPRKSTYSFVIDTGKLFQGEWKIGTESVRIVSRLEYEKGKLVPKPLQEGDYRTVQGSLGRLLKPRTLIQRDGQEVYSDFWTITPRGQNMGGYYCEIPSSVRYSYP